MGIVWTGHWTWHLAVGARCHGILASWASPILPQGSPTWTGSRLPEPGTAVSQDVILTFKRKMSKHQVLLTKTDTHFEN